MRFSWTHAFIVFLCLTPFLYAMNFPFPGGDDFARAHLSRYLFDLYEGLHEMLRAWWKWSGRYTHHFLVVFLGDLAESARGYTLACIGALCVFGVGLAGLFGTLTQSKTISSWLVPALMALLAVYGGIQLLPDNAYLLTGILSLWLSSASVIWFMWALCRLWHAHRVEKSHVVFPAVCGVVGIGFYEHSALAIFLAALFGWALARYCRHPHEALFKKIAFITGIALALMFFARGNFRRQTKRGTDIAVMGSQLLQAGADWYKGMAWFFRSIFPFAAVVLAFSISPKKRRDIQPAPPGLIICAGFFFILLLSTSITLVHAMSDITLNEAPKLPANLALLSGMVLCAVLMAISSPLREFCTHLFPPKLFAGFVVLAFCFVILWGAPNTLTTLSNLTNGHSIATYRDVEARMRTVHAARGSLDDLDIAPMFPSPYPLFFDTLSSKPQTWPNPQFALLYDLQSVRAVWPDHDPKTLEASASVPEYIPGIGQISLSKPSVTLNETYSGTWMLIHPENPCASLHMLLVPEPGPSRFIPQHLQKALLGLHGSSNDMLPATLKLPDISLQTSLTPSTQSRFTGYTRIFTREPSHDAWVIPAFSAATPPLIALFVSADGKEFRRVRLP